MYNNIFEHQQQKVRSVSDCCEERKTHAVLQSCMAQAFCAPLCGSLLHSSSRAFNHASNDAKLAACGMYGACSHIVVLYDLARKQLDDHVLFSRGR